MAQDLADLIEICTGAEHLSGGGVAQAVRVHRGQSGTDARASHQA